MCYDIAFTIDLRELRDYFPELVFDEQIKMDFGQTVHIVGHAHGLHPVIYTNRETGQLHCRLMEWGCIPFYIKDEAAFAKQRMSMLNARSERILGDVKSYWYKIRNRRCLVPVSGFYEHREVSGQKKKVPYYITLPTQKLFFIPGLYSVAELIDKQTGEIEKRFTYTIVTREANSLMKQIHNSGDNANRMPLTVPITLAELWVRDNISDDDIKTVLDFEMPSAELTAITVDTIRTQKPRADGKMKNEFFEWKGVEVLQE